MQPSHNVVGWFEIPVRDMERAIRFYESYAPSSDGVLIYMTAFSGDVDTELSRVEGAGGRVLQPKRTISEEHGTMAVFQDTEGNRIALHARTK